MGAPVGQVVDRDLGWKAILKAAKEISAGAFVKVGILGGDERGGLHAVGEDGKAADLTVAEIALVLEFGTEDGTIKPFNFVRGGFDEKRDELQAMAAKLVLAILDGKATVAGALNILGAKFAADLRNKIVTSEGIRDDAPATIKYKTALGSWNKGGKAQKKGLGPRSLIDTGRMLNALSWGVVLGSVEAAHKFLAGKATK